MQVVPVQDFSHHTFIQHLLFQQISPGKALKLSARAAKPYLMRLLVTVGFVSPGTLIARTQPLCLFVCLRSCFCYALLSGWPHGFPLALTQKYHRLRLFLRDSTGGFNLGNSTGMTLVA